MILLLGKNKADDTWTVLKESDSFENLTDMSTKEVRSLCESYEEIASIKKEYYRDGKISQEAFGDVPASFEHSFVNKMMGIED